MKKILNRAAALVSAVILMLTVQIPAAAQAKDINTALSQGKSLLRGLYVEIEENKCEGMIALRDLGDDYYEFDVKPPVGNSAHYTIEHFAYMFAHELDLFIFDAAAFGAGGQLFHG